jgi:hypothetical protein
MKRLKERIEQQNMIYDSIDVGLPPSPPVSSEPPSLRSKSLHPTLVESTPTPDAVELPPVEAEAPPIPTWQLRETRVKRLFKLSAMSREDMQKIWNELGNHIDNS